MEIVLNVFVFSQDVLAIYVLIYSLTWNQNPSFYSINIEKKKS